MRRSFITHLVCLFAVPLVVVGVAMPALAQCPLSFNAASNYAAGSRPYSVAVGDFNADGSPDLAVANSLGNNVSILLGNGGGGGTFQAAVNYAVGTNPRSVAVGDFNADGRPDLAVANFSIDNVSILLGNANGTFQAPSNYAAGSQPVSVAVGDFNADGRPDLAVANFSSNNVSILLGNGGGGGTFQAAVNYAAGTNPYYVAVGDFNADGRPDLAVANINSDNISILLGNGDGTFQPRVTYAVGNFPRSVAVGDFNADGRPDLAVANTGGNNVSILFGIGNGTFQAAVNYAVGSQPISVAVGDFNADGRPDLAVANNNSANVSILLGNLSGTFQAAVNYAVGTNPRSVAVGDFNADGRPDLAVANLFGNNVSVLLNTTLNFPAPIITQQPIAQAVLSGSTVMFTAAASSPAGAGPLSYQWRRNGVNLSNGGSISGATSAILTINPAALSDNGAAFDAVVTNDCGTARSDPAGLGVTWRCPADFNGSGVISVQDIFDFLAAYFAGCN